MELAVVCKLGKRLGVIFGWFFAALRVEGKLVRRVLAEMAVLAAILPEQLGVFRQTRLWGKCLLEVAF